MSLHAAGASTYEATTSLASPTHITEDDQVLLERLIFTSIDTGTSSVVSTLVVEDKDGAKLIPDILYGPGANAIERPNVIELGIPSARGFNLQKTVGILWTAFDVVLVYRRLTRTPPYIAIP